MTLKLTFAADGPRDKAVMPLLVSQILDIEIEPAFEPWKEVRLQSGAKGLGGYGRKLLFLIRDARDRGAQGVVATVDADRDKSMHKLRDLIEARDRDRQSGHSTPVAIGEAVPHLEAWLLDDEVAVRAALGVPVTTHIEAPTKVKSPKDELNRLCASAGIGASFIEILSSIAPQLVKEHCLRADHTGFEEFHKDVLQELGPTCNA